LKTTNFIFRISDLQKEKIMYLANLEQMNKSEYMRTLIERIDIDEESFNQWKIKRNEGNKGS
jgi:hypothetical protein